MVGAGAELMEFPARGGKIEMAAVLEMLGKREITSVMVEGGGLLLGSLFDDGLVDKVVAFIAPIIIGGGRAILSVSGEGVERVADASRLERISVEKFDDDVMISGYVKK
jgi:diaminohydroxyphosphoribosylaminopyrimidine deaminase/5-amino-6-(5-phosphoribosylamino)uracil reductase